MSKRAVILAGGMGTRLKPYTIVLPKPLMPIGEYPILEVVVRQLAFHQFDQITMAVNHQAELIKAFFGDGSKWNVKIDYSMEDQQLGTMGPLKCIPDLPENFLIMNGDVLTNLNYADFYNAHVQNQNLFTISAYRREHQIDYGVLKVDKNLRLSGFEEKPHARYNVSMGIYMANRKILEFIPENAPFGFDHLMLGLLAAKNQVAVQFFDGYWLDIGRPDDYALAIDSFEKLKGKFLP
ncbi:MAG: nucleotidyltransferase family protein [Calditrichales bacterium]|nr:MAG: nucleotidyltransferase family protein [Calditrichales bacterium]